MTDLILAVRDYAAWLYLLVLALMARQVATLRRAGRARASAAFGLEREAATGRTVRALLTLFLLGVVGAGVFVTSHVVAPTLPADLLRRGHDSGPLVQTPPTVALATDTPTRPAATATRPLPRIVTAAPEASPATAAARAETTGRGAAAARLRGASDTGTG